MSQVRQIKVTAIKNGTVIDHITAGKVLKVVEILDLNDNNAVMLGMNLNSKKLGKKDVLKIENRELSEEEVNKIALIAPEASLIIINDFDVVKKVQLTVPEDIENLLVCPNPKCITNMEDIPSKFKLTDNKPVTVRCVYCEKKYDMEKVKISV